MNTSDHGRDFIKHFEGFSAEAYPDPGSKTGEPWTIGFGHTGPDVKMGMKITRMEAGILLVKDLIYVEKAIERYVKLPVVQKEFDALASFIYNVGVAAFKDSSFLKLLNLGKRFDAAEEFLKWNKNDKAVMGVLVKRRAAERKLFLGFSYSESLKEGERAYEIYRQRLQNPRN
jgi:lysozyme